MNLKAKLFITLCNWAARLERLAGGIWMWAMDKANEAIVKARQGK